MNAKERVDWYKRRLAAYTKHADAPEGCDWPDRHDATPPWMARRIIERWVADNDLTAWQLAARFDRSVDNIYAVLRKAGLLDAYRKKHPKGTQRDADIQEVAAAADRFNAKRDKVWMFFKPNGSRRAS